MITQVQLSCTEEEMDCSVPVASSSDERVLVGQSAAFESIKKIARSVACRRSTILILGETGTGKEMLARHIHQFSDRADKPFVPVDCSAITGSLFESEMFGHVKGAFTGAVRDALGFVGAADGGTLFLDEIGELELPLQAKLLRVVQERQVTPVGASRPRPVNIRIITATNRNLQDMVRQGQFREDLYFRLSVVAVDLPPLRDRREDVLPLANYFLQAQARLYEEQVKTISPQAAQVLRDYPWPGNVRELANVMERAHVLASGSTLTVADLPVQVLKTAAPASEDADTLNLMEVKRRTIQEALDRTNHCKSAASRLLGVNVQRLNRLMKRLTITQRV